MKEWISRVVTHSIEVWLNLTQLKSSKVPQAAAHAATLQLDMHSRPTCTHGRRDLLASPPTACIRPCRQLDRTRHS